MESESPADVTLPELSRGWESLLDLEGVSAESKYRIRRLIGRARPLADKMFLKTVKGRETLRQCAELTDQVRAQLESEGRHLYEALTQLEKTFEDLLRKTYEFRVKAG